MTNTEHENVLGAPRLLHAALLILLCGALLYGHTLQVPPYLDDTRAIAENTLLRDLPAALQRAFTQRGLTNLTFAINYRLSGWALPPLHLTNLALHAASAWLAFVLLRRLLGSPLTALLGALLFLAHPLQTQAVTYLVQRATVLSGLLSLLALLCHLRTRDALTLGAPRTSRRYLGPYLATLICAGGAVLAKESAATLPLALIAYDRLFPLPLQRSRRQAILDYLPFFFVPCILGVTLLTAVMGRPGHDHLYYPLASLAHNSPLNYLATQFSVIWAYLRLIILPVGLALEHDYSVASQVLEARNIIAGSALLVVAWVLWRIRRRRPLLVFGAVWFFLGLAVESSVIPLDPLFEHRLYLPMFGVVLVLINLLLNVVRERWLRGVLLVMLLLCAPLTWQRNRLWNDPIAFYEDNLRVVPHSERAYLSLSVLYLRANRFADGERLLATARTRYPRNPYLHVNLALMMSKQRQPGRALAVLEEGMAQLPASADLFESAAAIAQHNGDPDRARGYLLRGLANPDADRARLLNTLGVLYSDMGDAGQSELALRESIALRPNEATPLLNLGKDYYAQRRWREALDLLLRADRLEPGSAETLEGIGKTALRLGDFPLARKCLGRLKHNDTEAFERLRQAIATEEAGLLPGAAGRSGGAG